MSDGLSDFVLRQIKKDPPKDDFSESWLGLVIEDGIKEQAKGHAMNPQPTAAPAAPITAEEIAALRDALSKATPGEWRTGEHLNENIEKALVCNERESLLMLHEHLDGDITAEIRRMPDCRFIALAHNLAPKLLAALDAAEAEIEKLNRSIAITSNREDNAKEAEAQAVEFAWDAFNRGTRIGYKSPTLGTHLETDKSTIKAAEYLEARGLLKRTGERMWQRVEGGK